MDSPSLLQSDPAPAFSFYLYFPAAIRRDLPGAPVFETSGKIHGPKHRNIHAEPPFSERAVREAP